MIILRCRRTTCFSLLLSIPVLSPCYRPILIAWYPVYTYRFVFLDHISALSERSPAFDFTRSLYRLRGVHNIIHVADAMQTPFKWFPACCYRLLSYIFCSEYICLLDFLSACSCQSSDRFKQYPICWVQISYHQLIADRVLCVGDFHPAPVAILSVSAY